jgi:hypothetical protein
VLAPNSPSIWPSRISCNGGAYDGQAVSEISLYSCAAVRLFLSSKNLNQNTGLFHLAGIELAPSAQSETLSKSLEVLFLGSNLFFRERWFDKRQERQCVKAFCVRCKTLAGDGSKSGEGDHFSECFPTGPIVLCCRSAAADRQKDQEGFTYPSPCC